MISDRRRAKAAKAQSRRAAKQPRHKDGRFKPSKTAAKHVFADDWSGGAVAAQKTETVEVGGRKYEIPVDEDGHVPEEALILRFANISEGNRKGTLRCVSRDLDKTSEKTLKLTKDVKPEDLAQWWAYPNESDIQGIDDETTRAFGTEGATRKSSLKYQERIGISGTPRERELVRKTLDENFTVDEMRKLTEKGGAYYYVNPDRIAPGAAGYYSPDTKHIVIGRGSTPGTIVHESVHKLRHIDEGRKGKHTSSKIGDFEVAFREDKGKAERIRAMEEAETECETVARLSPYGINRGRTSYYAMISKTPEEARIKIREDREKLVGNADPGKKGMRGRKAVGKIEKEFDSTHISQYAEDRKT